MNRTDLKPLRALAVLALAAAASVAPAGAAPLTQTDASWQVSKTAPPAGWNTSTAFDTSSWSAATLLYDVSFYLGSDYTAKAIWTSGGQFSTTETTMWARKIWNLATLPSSASLVGGFDDDADVWINGFLVISDHNGIANNVGVADLLPYLTAGDNLIAFTASDNYPVYGYNHAAWLQINGEFAAVPEPATGALLLSSLGLMAFSLRSRRRNAPGG